MELFLGPSPEIRLFKHCTRNTADASRASLTHFLFPVEKLVEVKWLELLCRLEAGFPGIRKQYSINLANKPLFLFLLLQFIMFHHLEYKMFY